MSNRPEVIAGSALMAYLRLALPAKVAAVNALRAATLQTPVAGTWHVTTGMQLKLSATSRAATPTTVTLPTGAAVTVAQLVTAINTAAVPGMTASADGDGRLVLTATTAPTSTASVVALHADTTGANALLGWDAGGETVITSPLRAPTHRGIRDGYPTTAPDMGQGFWVILGDRDARPWPSAGADIRRGECDVHFVVEVFKPEANLNAGSNREGITACVWAIRETLQTDVGRYLGHAPDVIRCDIGVTRVADRKSVV